MVLFSSLPSQTLDFSAGVSFGVPVQIEIRNSSNGRPFLHDFGSVPGSQLHQ